MKLSDLNICITNPFEYGEKIDDDCDCMGVTLSNFEDGSAQIDHHELNYSVLKRIGNELTMPPLFGVWRIKLKSLNK